MQILKIAKMKAGKKNAKLLEGETS